MKKGKTLVLFAILLAVVLMADLVWRMYGESHLSAAEGAGHGHEEYGQNEPTRADGHGDGEGHRHEGEKVVRLTPEETKQFGIETAVVGPGILDTRFNLPGEVSINADRMAHIVPRLAGVVLEVRKKVGDSVKKGELMAVITSRELADAKAEYLASVEKVALAQARFNREERLWRKKITAEQEYLDARQALAEGRIVLRAAEQKLHSLGFSDEYLKGLPKLHDESYTRYEVIAPFEGTVIKKHITLGEAIKEDADIFIVADLSNVWVNINVYQKDLPLVHKGQKVTISAGHGIPDGEGTIGYLAPILDEETRTALARIVLPNPSGQWRPGMFVTAKVGVEELSVPMLVPKSCLQTVDGKTVVFVLTKEGFEPKPVTLGRASEKDTEIISGLNSGERYAVKGAFTLKAQLSKGSFGEGHSH